MVAGEPVTVLILVSSFRNGKLVVERCQFYGDCSAASTIWGEIYGIIRVLT